MTKTITKLDRSRFKVVTDKVPDSTLELNFKPLIEQFKLKNDKSDFLVHWQARPKGYRQWGIYSLKNDSYISVKSIVFNRVLQQTLQLKDSTAVTVPSAVIKVENARLILIEPHAILCVN